MSKDDVVDILEDIIETFRGDDDYMDWIRACRYAIAVIQGGER